MDGLLYILRMWTISISTVLGRPIRWKMNGLEERRGILATIWFFHAMMDGAPRNGASADTHCTDTHTHIQYMPHTQTCFMLSFCLAACQHFTRNQPITSPSLPHVSPSYQSRSSLILKQRVYCVNESLWKFTCRLSSPNHLVYL